MPTLPATDSVAGHSLGLYVHLPWCVRKCPYCDFNSHPLRGDVPAEEYIAALLQDLTQWARLVKGREITSIFFGGGTPSLFSGSQIAALLEGVTGLVDISGTVEITLEANPGTIERDAFRAYRDAGVNRVSLGVQSFDNAALHRLGRIHGRSDIERSLRSLERAGLDNFNIDLMFGLPAQSPEGAIEDVRLALEAGPAHVSHYQLTLEPNTAFAADPPALPEEDTCWIMQEACGELLSNDGLRQYEVSAWARPGRECAHNLNYWRFGDYIGIGAGAHGKLTCEGTVRRWNMPRQPRVYLSRQEPSRQWEPDAEERVFEFFLNRLRLREGFTRQELQEYASVPWRLAEPRVQEAMKRGLLTSSGGEFRTTGLGWRFLNDTQQIFLP